MLQRSTLGVLGVLVAGLALAALAAQPGKRPSSHDADVAQAPPRRRVLQPSAAAMRALRDGERIAINSARAEDLELLPGIGPTLAQRIVAHRDAHGAFAAAEALLQVRGIGQRTLERLTPLLSFEPAHSSKTNTTAAATVK